MANTAVSASTRIESGWKTQSTLYKRLAFGTRIPPCCLKETGAGSIASAGEASSDFAKTDRPARRHAEHLVIVKEISADSVASPGETSADLPKTEKIAQRVGV